MARQVHSIHSTFWFLGKVFSGLFWHICEPLISTRMTKPIQQRFLCTNLCTLRMEGRLDVALSENLLLRSQFPMTGWLMQNGGLLSQWDFPFSAQLCLENVPEHRPYMSNDLVQSCVTQHTRPAPAFPPCDN